MNEVSILKILHYGKEAYAVIVSDGDKPSNTINIWQQEHIANYQAEIIRNAINNGDWKE